MAFAPNVHAQTNRDSLTKVLATTKDPRQQIDILLKLCSSYMLESPQEVRRHSLRALTLADSIHDDKSRIASLGNLAWAARVSGDYAQSLEYASKCLKAAEEARDNAGIAAARYEMAAVYQAQKDYNSAREMFIKARPYFEAVEDIYGVGKCFNGVGESYRWQGKWDSALTNYSKAESYFLRIDHKKGMVFIKANRGLVYEGQGKYEIALDSLKEANSMAMRENFMPVYLESAVAIARVLHALGQTGQALSEAEAALVLADSLELSRYGKEAAEALYQFAIVREDYHAALNYQKKIHDYESDMHTEEVAYRLSSLDFDLKMRDKEAEILGLQKDQRIRSLWQTLLFVLMALVFVIFLLMAYAYRRNRKTTRLLAQQNEQLGELNREKDSLMHIVAHDLKSPLSKVKALAAMAAIAGPLTDRQKTALTMIENVITDGEKLIQDLLDISRAESAQSELKLESGDLNTWVSDWMAPHKENAARKNMAVHFDAHPAPIQVHTENSYVSRIFDNLLSNAIKYTPPGMEVRVSTQTDGKYFYIAITDQGPGISPEDQEKMFRKFQRLTARPTAGESSTGLGLSIIKTLTNRLHGDIQLESSLGIGSIFTVKLPLDAKKVPSA